MDEQLVKVFLQSCLSDITHKAEQPVSITVIYETIIVHSEHLLNKHTNISCLNYTKFIFCISHTIGKKTKVDGRLFLLFFELRWQRV